jgi:hypothetical protein
MTTPEEKLASKYNQRFSVCADMRQNYERQWYYNLAFYFGRQHVQWVGSVAANKFTLMDVKPRQSWRARLVSNKIKPIIRNELTKLTKEEMQFYVVPATTEESDIFAARAGESLAEFVLDDSKFNRVRRQATLWALLTGTGYIKTYYDQGYPVPGAEPGKIILDALSSFPIYVPLLDEEDIQVQPYVFHQRSVDPNFIKEKWGVDVTPDNEAKAEYYEERLRNVLGIQSKGYVPQSIVREVWVRPNQEFPNGAMFIIQGKNVLYMYEDIQEAREDAELDAPVGDSDVAETPTRNPLELPETVFPYEHGEYPFQKIIHIPAARYYGLSVIEDLIPLQKEYNRSRSQIIETKNKTASGQWVVPKGSVNPAQITSQPGLVITYQPGFEPPKAIKQPDLPAYVLQDLDRTLKDMDDISGQYEVAHGRTPPGVEAASAIAYLQEENDTRLYHTTASIEEAAQNVGSQILALVDQCWTDQKMVKVVSKNNYTDVKMFRKADMKGNTDFRIEPGSMAPKSRAARNAMMLELVDRQILPPDKILKYLQMVDTNQMYNEMQLDDRQAQRENIRMSEGISIPINEYDNHAAHIMSHENFMKTEEYELLDESSRQIFLLHDQEHKMALQMLQMQNQPLEGQAPNDSGEPAQPSPGELGTA